MGAFLLLLLLGDGTRPDAPRPKPEIRRVQVDLTPAPPPARPRKETAAERRRRKAEEKQMEAILKVLDSKQQVGLLGVLRADSPNADLVAGPPSDPEGISRVVKAHTGAIRYCYEKELANKPDLAGRVTTHFVIDKDGVVTEATIKDSSLGDDVVESCILRQIRSWRFPAKATTVTYPFRFENS